MDTSGVGSSKVEYVREHAFEVGPRYANLSYIGEGAYGMVVCVMFHVCTHSAMIVSPYYVHLVDLVAQLLFPIFQLFPCYRELTKYAAKVSVDVLS